MSEQTNTPSSAAALLLQARLAKELTLDQVSLQTRIPRDLIQALEDKNWNALPGAPYARAFCKTLAQAYDLDSELVLAGLRNDMGMQSAKGSAPTKPTAVEIGVSSNKDDAQANKTPLILAGILAIALVLVLAATRLAFKPGTSGASAPIDSLKTDSLEADTIGEESLAISKPLAPVVAQPNRKTATIRLSDTNRPAFILYMRQGIPRIRKKSLSVTDTLEFDPDTAVLIRNLSKQPLRISGALNRDSIGQTYFRVVRRSDTVRFETISEATWEEKTGSILDRQKRKTEN